MSSEIQQSPTTAAQSNLACSYCACELQERMLAVQLYPDNSSALPTAVDSHGGLTLCPTCASEVVELLAAWDDHGKPPVSRDRIGDGYGAVASECSFCGDRCRDEILGIELYRRVGDRLPAYANYTLCGDCQQVFDEFLDNLRTAYS